MPLSWTLPEAVKIQQLRDHAKTTIPDMFWEDDRAEEILEMAIVQFVLACGQIEDWLSYTYIDVAFGKWLDQHGIDRGVFRQVDESDDLYRPRIKLVGDIVTKPAILAAIQAVLDAGSGGTAVILEPRCDLGAYCESPGATEDNSYCSRGYRLLSLSTGAFFIVALPLGTTDAEVASITNLVLSKKAAGVKSLVTRNDGP